VEEVRKGLRGFPVYVGVEDDVVYIKLTGRLDDRQFRRYVETCKRLGFKFRGGRWIKEIRQHLNPLF